jgi:hypothetical protein
MAIIFMDGFDKYMPAQAANPGNAVYQNWLQELMLGDWTSPSISTNGFIISPLSATGGAIFFSDNSNHLIKTLSTNYATGIGGIRLSTDLLAVNDFIRFFDTATEQGGLRFNTNGTLTILGAAGAVVATSSATITANTTHYIEWSITFASSGAYTVYLDGTQILTGTGNFKSSANAFYQTINLGNTSGGVKYTFDDFYVDDGSGTVLLTNPVVETHIPVSDTATAQFTIGNAVFGAWLPTVATTNAPGANQLFLRPFTPSVSCTINSVSCIPSATSAGANFKAVIYADSAGAPAGLLSSGAQVTGAVLDTVLTGNLVTPQALTASTQYWIGFITDTSVLLHASDANTTGRKIANTYTSGAPGTAGAMTAGQTNWCLWGTITGVSFHFYEETASPSLSYLGDFSYVQSSTVGNEDLYNIGALTANPPTIYSVAIKAQLRDSDAGLRTVSLNQKSGGVDSAGTAFSPSTSYQWFGYYLANDPNTSSPWTVGNLNAATGGFKVVS